MLEFLLVTGHVPGTNIDITFTQFLLSLPVLGLAVYYIRKHRTVITSTLRRLVAQAVQLELLLRRKLLDRYHGLPVRLKLH